MKKKTKSLIVALIFLIILLSVRNNIKPFAVIDPEKDYSPPYVCPSGENIRCNVKGLIECSNLLGGRDIVKFRGNSDYHKTNYPVAFAIPDSSVMRSYTYLGKQLSNNVCDEKSLTYLYVVTNPLAEIYWRNNELIICHEGAARVYELGGIADTSISLKSGEVCNQGRVRCSEVSGGYSCNGEIRIDKSLTDKTLLYREALSYSSQNQQGSDISAQYTINSGNVVYVTGGSKNIVKSEVVDVTQACRTDECITTNSYRRCENNRLSFEVSSCGNDLCILNQTGKAQCISSYNSTAKVISGFTINQDISFQYSVQSTSVKIMEVTFKLLDSRDRNNPILTKPTEIINLPVTNKIISFPSQDLPGDYIILVQEVVDGNKIEKEFLFTIGNPFYLTLTIPYSDLTGTKLLVGSPFYIDVLVKEGDLDIISVAKINAKATIIDSKTNQISLLISPQPVLVKTQNGVAERYTFIVNKSGKFSFEASANKFGVPSNTERRTSEIRLPDITIKYDNIAFLQKSLPGVHIIQFSTVDSFGDYIESNPKVTIRPQEAGTGQGDITVLDSSIISIDTGKYEFSYKFEEGSYIIVVQTRAEGYPIQSTIPSPAFNIDIKNKPIECSESQQCQPGYLCLNGKCWAQQEPTINYIIWIAGAIMLLIIIYLAYKLIKKKQTPDLGIGGL